MANSYKKTTNLPKTGFPMRAGLASSEPKRLAAWEEADVYGLACEQNRGNEPFVLHDGPPYANGPIHLGHALNKTVKDFINRYQIMRGREVSYVPGWDCHGQPIEHKVEEHLGTERFNATDPSEIRSLCRRFAVENIDLQRQGFRRCFGPGGRRPCRKTGTCPVSSWPWGSSPGPFNTPGSPAR